MEILGIWILFDRFKLIQGWTLSEVAILYGIMNMGFSLVESFARGCDTFDRMVKTGDFDRVLLRPVGSLVQIATREVALMRLGRFVQGFIVLLWGASAENLSFFSMQTAVIVEAVIGTACLFYGLIIIQATISFWTTDSLEVMNIATFGGMEVGQYPMTVYSPGFRWVFTFLIPIACVGYYPIATSLKHDTFPFWSAFLFPLVGILFLFLACRFWRFGVRHYCSTGS